MKKSFGRYVHWGYGDDPQTALSDDEDYAAAAAKPTLELGQLAGIAEGQDVLDVGCGFGRTIASLNERFGKLNDAISSNFLALRSASRTIAAAADLMTEAVRAGNKIIFCGNGGSAADSQHLAAELVGRYLKDRAALPALALTVDTSALTAIGNDYSFAAIFARQLSGLGKPGDVLVALEHERQ